MIDAILQFVQNSKITYVEGWMVIFNGIIAIGTITMAFVATSAVHAWRHQHVIKEQNEAAQKVIIAAHRLKNAMLLGDINFLLLKKLCTHDNQKTIALQCVERLNDELSAYNIAILEASIKCHNAKQIKEIKAAMERISACAKEFISCDLMPTILEDSSMARRTTTEKKYVHSDEIQVAIKELETLFKQLFITTK